MIATGIQVSIQSIISQRTWGSILRARVEEQNHDLNGHLIRVKAFAKGMLGMPIVGEVWRVEGVILDGEWGPQLEVERAVREAPTGHLIEAFLAASVPGIGVERAARLWHRWGIGLADVLSDDSRIAEIADAIAPDRPTFGPALAASCCKAWREAESSTRTLLWLADQGFEDVQLARRIIAILGDSAVDELQKNPYVLVALLPWAKVDEAGLRIMREAGIEVPRRDPRRLVGAVDAGIKLALRDGHTSLDDSTIRATVAKHLGVASSSSSADQAISLGAMVGAIVQANGMWRAPGCAVMEDDLVATLRSMLDQSYPTNVDLPSLDRISSLLNVLCVGGHTMHSEQQRAVLNLLQRPLSLLQGGAGTGKTTCLRAVCDLWVGAGGNVISATISGKAALRLARSTGRIAMTLARLLGQLRERCQLESQLFGESLSEKERRHVAARLKELAEITSKTLVVIDEASMVDLSTAYELSRRLLHGSRLLLVGDEAQLPPVSFGLVYHQLVGDSSLTQKLSTVHRQTDLSGIPAVAANIRKGQFPSLPTYFGRGDGVSILLASPQELQAAVVRVWDDLGGRKSGTLICTATKAGVAGTGALNAVLQRRHAERNDLTAIKGFYSHWYSAGDPVVWLKNNYGRGLFNGLLGYVLAAHPEEGLSIQFEGYDEAHQITPEQLIDLALAYAITCHRAQGSQAPAVVVPMYPSKVLDPSWLYTAVTRAERQVVLVGDPSVMASAIAKPWAARSRKVGLNW